MMNESLNGPSHHSVGSLINRLSQLINCHKTDPGSTEALLCYEATKTQQNGQTGRELKRKSVRKQMKNQTFLRETDAEAQQTDQTEKVRLSDEIPLISFSHYRRRAGLRL